MMKSLRLSGLCLALAVVIILGIGGTVSNVSAADPVQIILNDANMTLTHTTIGDRDATYTDPTLQEDINLPLHYKLNDGEWNILWNVGTFPDPGTPILTTGPLGNNAGDILTIGAVGQGDSPLISGGVVTPDSSTQISVAWDPLHIEGTFQDSGDPYTIDFSNVITTLSVDGPGTISLSPLSPVSFNILLGRPTDNSVTANIISDQDVQFYIAYRDSSGDYTGEIGPFAVNADEPVEKVIGGGFPANSENFYHIRYKQAGTTEWNEGPEYSFHTQKARGSTFTFTIISDSHLGQYGGQTADEYALYTQTLQNVGDDHPDFHIDLGDTFAMDPSPLGTGMTEAEADAAYLIERPYLKSISHSVPIYLAIGNHENEEGWNFDDVFTAPDKSLAIVGLKARLKYFPNPIPDDFYTGNADALPAQFLAAYPGFPFGEAYHEDYYAWEWGDALFVVLDPYHYSMTWPSEGNAYGGEGQDGEVGGDRWDWTLGIEQYLWFKNVLETSDATYKFVFSHHVTGGSTVYGRGGIDAAPYFEWGGKNADGSWGWDTKRPASEGWDVPIHQLMVANGVNVYFHGHDHIYAREELDGIVYLECPKPDDAGYDWEPYGYGYNENLYPNAISILQNSGHIRVVVSPNNVKMDYVRSYLPGDGTNGVIADSVTIVKPCQGDFAPSDGDVDGLDLAWQIAHSELDLSVFAANFGRTTCS